MKHQREKSHWGYELLTVCAYGLAMTTGYFAGAGVGAAVGYESYDLVQSAGIEINESAYMSLTAFVGAVVTAISGKGAVNYLRGNKS